MRNQRNLLTLQELIGWPTVDRIVETVQNRFGTAAGLTKKVSLYLAARMHCAINQECSAGYRENL